jgi:hypothetical protein
MVGDHRWKEPAVVVAIIGVAVALVGVLVAFLAFGRDILDFTMPDNGSDPTTTSTTAVSTSPGPDDPAANSGSPAGPQPSSQVPPPPGAKRILVRLSPNDPLPQGVVEVSPPELGPDYWTGDFSIECLTPGKNRTQQNCLDADERRYILAPVGGAVTIAAVEGDAMTRPELCRESNGAEYRPPEVTLRQGADYCVRTTDEPKQTIVIRAVRLSDERPRPVSVLIYVLTLPS